MQIMKLVLLSLFCLFTSICCAKESSAPCHIARIGNKIYSDKDLIGISKDEFLSTVKDDAKGISREQLLDFYYRIGGREKFDKAGIEEIVNSLGLLEYNLLVSTRLTYVLISGVFANLVANNCIAVDSYYNVEALKKSILRNLDFGSSINANKSANPAEYEKLYDTMKKELSLSISFDEWKGHMESAKASLNHIGPIALKSMTAPEAIQQNAQSILAHEILSSACDKGGRFFEDAIKQWQFTSSSFYVIDIENFSCDREKLEKVFSMVVDTDGAVVHGGLQSMTGWINRLSSFRKISYTNMLWTNLQSYSPLPSFKLIQNSGTAYTAIGYQNKNILSKEVLASITSAIRQNAFLMASQRFLPKFKLLSQDIKYDLQTKLRGLADSPQFFITPLDFVKKKYPASMFANNDVEIDNLIADSLVVLLENNKDNARKFVNGLLAKARAETFLPYKVACLDIAFNLADSFELTSEKENITTIRSGIIPE